MISIATSAFARRWRPILSCAGLIGVALPAAGQSARSIAGVNARYGWGPTGRLDDAFGIGAELEILALNPIVPSARFEYWDFGIACTGFGPCPNGVTIAAVGLRYRIVGETPVVPYLGGDVGYMKWTSYVAGVSLRVRAGADIRVIRHVDLNVDGGYARFIEIWHTDERTLQNHLIAFGAGLRLWF